MGTDAGVDEAPGRGVLYMISPSSSMAAGLEGREGKGENEISVFIGGRAKETDFNGGHIGPSTQPLRAINSRLGAFSLGFPRTT